MAVRPYPVGEQADRNMEIYRKRLDGATFQAIGEEYGLSKDRIREICKREEFLLRWKRRRRERSMDVGTLFKRALRAMLDEGEFDKIAEYSQEHAKSVLEWRDRLAKVESDPRCSNSLGDGIESLSIAYLLGELAKEEPVCADALSFMLRMG